MAEPMPSLSPDLMAVNTTWNPSDLSGITLSNGNLTATSNAASGGVRAALSSNSGKYYWEVTATTVVTGSNESIGIGNAGASLTSALTTSALINNAAGNLYVNSSVVSGGNSWVAGAVIGVAVDFTAKLIWFRTTPTGNWNGVSTNNPATGTGGASFSALTGPFFPQLWINSGSGHAYTANFGDSAFVGAVPSGFTSGFPGAAASASVAPFIPHGPVPYLAYPATMDYPRLVFSAPRFEVVAIADIINPSVQEAVQGMLPTLVPPYVNSAANAAVQALAVQLVGSTMTGPLMLSPAIPTANTMAATKQYVDSMVATSVPEVPAVPAGATWNRQTGQWVQAVGGGTVTNIATGAGLTGGPITATGTISMANMAANSIKGNNTGAVASPTDIPAGTVLTMIGGAPLASPVFTGAPVLPTGTTGVTQGPAVNNTTLATTAYVTAAIAAAPAGVASFNTRTGAVTLQLADVTGVGGAPLANPAFTGNPIGPTPATADSSVSLATTAFVKAQGYATTTQLGGYLPLTSGTLSNTLIFSGGQGIHYSGTTNNIALGWNATQITGNVDGTGSPGPLMNATGVTNGSNAPAGQVGEYMTNSGGPAAVGNNSPYAVVGTNLTAGDWDVWGFATAEPAGATLTSAAGGIGTSNAALPGQFVTIQNGTATLNTQFFSTPFYRFNITANTTVYLVVQHAFSSTCNARGTIYARRVR